jgi:hypothetical protein
LSGNCTLLHADRHFDLAADFLKLKHDYPVKSRIFLFRHSGLDPESSYFNRFWIPAFAGMTILGLFTVSSTIEISKYMPTNLGKIIDKILSNIVYL